MGLRSLKISVISSKRQVPLFCMLISGGAGVSKLHLIKTVHMALNKLLLHKSRDPDKPRILLFAPTGIAAIKIGGTTALGIGISSKLVLRSDKQKVKLREKLDIKLIIIDEISMVYSQLLFQLNKRLIEIFECRSNKLFAGIPMILCGDLYQLPPIGGKPIYMSNQSVKGYIALAL